MKKYLSILIIILAIVFASGCTDNGNETSGNVLNNTKVYNGDGFTFEYPLDWETIVSQGRDSIVAVGDPNSADASGNAGVNVVIQKTVKPQGMQLKDYYNATYTQFASGNVSFVPVSDGTIVINGITAYENVYKVNSGGQKQQRAIWIPHNNLIYIILCSAPVSDYNNQQENFNKIINSFKFI
ncbi:PsbP-related protein [Methanobacterium sp. ACI-7]|uniref:PsbP-related protein n=1 Tax=unclassified Methanobacterium TaxID=2627676 RepID=UPI0039C2BAA2